MLEAVNYSDEGSEENVEDKVDKILSKKSPKVFELDPLAPKYKEQPSKHKKSSKQENKLDVQMTKGENRSSRKHRQQSVP